jgi:hypothetical protein
MIIDKVVKQDVKVDSSKEQPFQEPNYLKPVAWAILAMGVSIAIIIIFWISIGHIGSSYSSDAMIKQQVSLRHQYDLSPKPVITDPKMLEIPPSLRPPSMRDCIPDTYC